MRIFSPFRLWQCFSRAKNLYLLFWAAFQVMFLFLLTSYRQSLELKTLSHLFSRWDNFSAIWELIYDQPASLPRVKDILLQFCQLECAILKVASKVTKVCCLPIPMNMLRQCCGFLRQNLLFRISWTQRLEAHDLEIEAIIAIRSIEKPYYFVVSWSDLFIKMGRSYRFLMI